MLTPTYPLLTGRLQLRPYASRDLEPLLEMFGDPIVCRYLDWEPMDRAAATRTLERRQGQTRILKEGDAVGLVVAERETDRYVGEVVLGLTSAEHRQGNVGWSIHPAAQGHGYATEAAREVLRLGFADLALHRIIAETDPRNAGSIRVMEKLGMRREADHVDAMFLKGEWVGSTIFALLDSEWDPATGGDPPV